MTPPIPTEVQAAIDAQLPAIRERLSAGQEPLDIHTQEKGNGVIVVTVQHAHSPSTATFELHPHTHGEHLAYTCDEVDYSSNDY